MCYNPTTRSHYVAGLTSFGDDPCASNVGSQYTKVANYLDFIRMNAPPGDVQIQLTSSTSTVATTTAATTTTGGTSPSPSTSVTVTVPTLRSRRHRVLARRTQPTMGTIRHIPVTECIRWGQWFRLRQAGTTTMRSTIRPTDLI